MKKIISSVCTLLLILTVFSACGKPEKKLVGTWKGEVSVLGISTEYEYTFNEDGTGKMTGVLGSTGVSFNYTVSEDGKLNITTALLGVENTKSYTYTVEKNVLTLTDDESNVTLTKAE